MEIGEEIFEDEEIMRAVEEMYEDKDRKRRKT